MCLPLEWPNVLLNRLVPNRPGGRTGAIARTCRDRGKRSHG